jgi:hypothetical protein
MADLATPAGSVFHVLVVMRGSPKAIVALRPSLQQVLSMSATSHTYE